MLTRITYWGMVCALVVGASGVRGGEHDAESMRALAEEALQNNPEIIGLRKAAAAARVRVPQAGTLPDPMVKLGVMNLPVNSFRFDREPMTGKQIMLTQRLPVFGTLGLQFFEPFRTVFNDPARKIAFVERGASRETPPHHGEERMKPRNASNVEPRQ